MSRSFVNRLFPVALLVLVVAPPVRSQAAAPARERVVLPAPAIGTFSLDAALRARRTTRSLTGPALSLGEAAQLLWSAQGENRPGRRTVPSARARYPLDLYLVTEGSPTLAAGTYRYLPGEQALRSVGAKGVAALLGTIKGMQPWIAKSPSVFVVTGTAARMSGSDADARRHYTFWESGAASQALLLQATALGLGSGVASGVDLEAVGAALGLPPEEKATILLPVGRLAPGEHPGQ